MTTATNISELLDADRRHVVHAQQNMADHADPLVWVRGHGATLVDVHGREFLDGLSCLWNVSLGHGRQELARVAAEQMAALAFAVNYSGSTHIPVILLAERLVQLAPSNMEAVFFTNGGAEANEAAFKTARFYWRAQGKPSKVKIIAREYGYHGVTMAAMSATGMSRYHTMFGPLVPNFVHTVAPYPFRFQGQLPGETVGQAAARMLEETIVREDPETVAAFIAEPVMGAGGIIVPPDDYFARVRDVCSRHSVLFIADEVITGFCRTGRWFALEHWNVQPDIVTFAKGITSGYLPLGGMMVSGPIHETMLHAPSSSRWMHACTYSGHPVCCAVALRTLEIMEREGLADAATRMGERLLTGLQGLSDLAVFGEARGLGLMCAVELVADRATKAAFDPAQNVMGRIKQELLSRGLYTRFARDSIIELAPPLVVTEQQVDRMVAIIRDAITPVCQGRA